jgi:hypothetical protein
MIMISDLQQKTDTSAIFRLGFEDLTIEPAVVEDFVGFPPGMSPEPFPSIIGELLAQAEDKIKPTGGYVVFDACQTNPARKSITVQGTEFFTNTIVTKHLERSSAVALFVCTAGSEISRWAATFNDMGQSIHAYIVDSIGSIAVEKAMDVVQARLESELRQVGLRVTNRYSPGYCNWDTAEQKKLFSLLPEEFCGITLNDSMLMKPIKSISGIIGIGKDVRYRKYTCNFCKDKHCLYRNKR